MAYGDLNNLGVLNLGTASTGSSSLPSFAASLITSVIPQRTSGSAVPSYSRATTAYVTDWEGVLKGVSSGETRFQGARRVGNQCGSSEALTIWTKVNSPTVTAGITAPDGTATAFQLDLPTANAAPAGASGIFAPTAALSTTGGKGRASIWVKADAPGTITVSDPAHGSYLQVLSVTTGWQRLTGAVFTNLGSAARMWISRGAADLSKVYVWHPQVEDVSGQSNQNPSEYISAGVLSSPYHGAMVDGIKYFDTQNGNTVSSGVVTEATGVAINSSTSKFAQLPGVSGSYFSTPNSGANSITGDIDIDALVDMDDWTPAAGMEIISKLNSIPGSYDFFVDTSGQLNLRVYIATVQKIATSSAAVSAADGTAIWVRAKRQSSTGNVTFYTSQDGTTWTQLGTVQSTTSGSIDVVASGLEIGTNTGGTTAKLIGRVYRARIYNGFRDASGTLAVDFNPNIWTTGTTWTSATTGEVWTINGSASVYVGSWNATGPFGYLSEGTRTNLCLRSKEFDNASWSKNNTTVVADQAVGPDGTLSADLMYPTTTGANRYISQTMTNTVATYAFSVDVKAAGFNFIYFIDPPGSLGCWFNLSTGAVGTNSTALTAAIEALPNGWYRCSFTGTSIVTAPFYIGLADANGSFTATTSGTNGVYLTNAQNELGGVPSSRIVTTSATVTRNTDLLSYQRTNNLSGTTGTIYSEITGSPTLSAWIVGDSNAAFYCTPVQLDLFDGTNNLGAKAITLSTTSTQKVAGSWNATAGITAVAGSSQASGTFDGDMGWVGTFGVGASLGGNNLFGTVRNLLIYPAAFNAGKLQNITS